jgi:hypothetical protein
MRRTGRRGLGQGSQHRRNWQSASEGVAILEFAVTLPFLLVLAIGIFDFGRAFDLKQKLNNTAREAARFGASSPTIDLPQSALSAAPASVIAIRDLVDFYLKRAKINDCGLASVGPPSSAPALIWTYTASGSGCPGGGTLTLIIDRGNAAYPANIGGTAIDVVSTHVTISYPYSWQFNRVISFMVAGSTVGGPALITADAVVANLD